MKRILFVLIFLCVTTTVLAKNKCADLRIQCQDFCEENAATAKQSMERNSTKAFAEGAAGIIGGFAKLSGAEEMLERSDNDLQSNANSYQNIYDKQDQCMSQCQHRELSCKQMQAPPAMMQ